MNMGNWQLNETGGGRGWRWVVRREQRFGLLASLHQCDYMDLVGIIKMYDVYCGRDKGHPKAAARGQPLTGLTQGEQVITASH
jgi:hypothetical protein